MTDQPNHSVWIIAAAETDRPTLEHTHATLKQFGIAGVWRVAGTTRAAGLAELAREVEDGECQVVIAAGHPGVNLPSILAAATTKPVLGVPMEQAALKGTSLDALLSSVQGGGGAACLAVGKAGAINAALQAVAILSLIDPALVQKLDEFRQRQTAQVLAERV